MLLVGREGLEPPYPKSLVYSQVRLPLCHRPMVVLTRGPRRSKRLATRASTSLLNRLAKPVHWVPVRCGVCSGSATMCNAPRPHSALTSEVLGD